VASKFVRQTVKKAEQSKAVYLASECPLAGKHIAQGSANAAKDGEAPVFEQSSHPIQLLAKAYGF